MTSYDLVILNEAQRIKNWNTRTARSIKRIASPYAIVLTGTPLENRLEELMSIVEFVDKHRLGPTFRFLADHQVRDDETGKVVGYRHLDRIGQTLAPILLRRTKAQVLTELPRAARQELLRGDDAAAAPHHEENREVVARIVAKWRRYKFLSEADQRRLMIALQNMRMSCDSTYLLDSATDFGTKADQLATLLDELLEQPDAKVVVFSQWVRMHEVLVRRLARKKFGHVLFNSQVPGVQRKALVNRFRDDPRCPGVSLDRRWRRGIEPRRAVSVVVNINPRNPAVLEQRIGRVHRLGQRRPVQVVNFIAQGTIEEGMLSVLSFKDGPFAGVLDRRGAGSVPWRQPLNRFIERVQEDHVGNRCDIDGDCRRRGRGQSSAGAGEAEGGPRGRVVRCQTGPGRGRRGMAGAPSGWSFVARTAGDGGAHPEPGGWHDAAQQVSLVQRGRPDR